MKLKRFETYMFVQETCNLLESLLLVLRVFIMLTDFVASLAPVFVLNDVFEHNESNDEMVVSFLTSLFPKKLRYFNLYEF